MAKQLRRVAVTGLGSICGLGHNVNEVWSKIIAGQSGINLIEQFDAAPFPTKFAGEVKNFSLSPDLLPEREAPRYDRFVHFSLHSGHEALLDAGLLSDHPYQPHRMGCIMGVGIGGLPYIEKNFSDYLDKGLRRISPFFIPGIIANMGAGMLSIRFNLQGTSYSTSSACASASHAIGAACQEIMLGRQDVVISGGAESVICLMGIGGFSVMKALSRNENFQQASRPFDSGRDGFVMGEGAGMLVLEDLEKAQNRGAKIYAEIVGFAASSDANHITAPHPEGLGARNCMLSAIESADIKVEDIDYVNAHGTSTPLGDIAETKAIRKTFGQHAEKLLVSSTKSMTGHLLGAAGGIESVFCIKALATGQIPPTINLVNQDPECDLNYVPLKSVQKSIQYALNNSFGFGGTNATTIFKKFS